MNSEIKKAYKNIPKDKRDEFTYNIHKSINRSWSYIKLVYMKGDFNFPIEFQKTVLDLANKFKAK